MVIARVSGLLKRVVAAAALAIPPMLAQAVLELVDRIELAESKGRLDHLAIDSQGSRLFIAALGADAIEVVDRQGRGQQAMGTPEVVSEASYRESLGTR